MSTIAELLVKIGADNSGLKKTLTDSQSSIQSAFSANPVNEFTGALTGATNGISGMVGKMSGLAALAAGGFGLGSMVQGAVDAGESIYQLSTKMGISAGEGAELSRILKLTGGDTQTFSTAMLRLDKSYTASGEAGEKCRATLQAVGVSLTDSNGKLLPLNQQLEQLSKGYQVAAASGQQEEFLMNTLGARGLSLVKTLKDYNEAKEAASQVQGAGLDPAQMHELGIQMKVVSLEASQIGLAFTSALAPVAQEIFPPIMSGLKTTAAFLSENKTELVGLTKDALELALAYKSIQLLASASNSISAFWQAAATEAAASTAIQATSANELSAAQERSIARTVAASNRMYAKMEADAVKTANSLMVSAEETQAIIAEKCVQISTAATAAAESIRTQMTEAFLQSNAAAVEGATTVTEALTIQGEAAAVAGEKMVAANTLGADSARAGAVAQGELAAATVVSGNTAVATGEKTVGAMAVAETATWSLGKAVWALVGGWLGVAAAIAYAAYQLYQYGQQMGANYESTYGQQVPLNQELNDGFNGQTLDDTAPVATDEQLGQGARNARNRREAPPAFVPPQVDLSGIGGLGGGGGHTGTGGKSDAERELEKLQREAEQVNKEIDNAYQELMLNKVERVNEWYNKEKEKLDASKENNKRYEEEVGELNTVYAEKKRKAYAEMLSNSTNIWVEAARSQRELNDLVSTAGLEGPIKDLTAMQNKYNNELAETEERYKKLNVSFMNMDTESQTQFLLSHPGMSKNADGSLNYSKQLAQAEAAINKNKELEIRNYHQEEKQWENDFDKAMNDRSMSELQTLLSKEEALQAQKRTGETAAMQEYYDLWKKTHRTAMDEMAEATNSLDQGLESMFENIGKDINSLGSLFRSFGQLVSNIFMKIAAERVAAQATSGLSGFLGGLFGITQQNPVSAQASSWSSSNGGTAPTFENGGLGLTGIGTGGSWTNPAKLATGGIVTGPTLAVVGEGQYNEAVIPLNDSNLGKLGNKGNNNATTINMNVYPNDVQGFKKSQNQIMAEAYVAAARGRRNL